MKQFKTVKPGIIMTLGVGAMMQLISCSNPVFDYEGDCEVTYNLRFLYDMNLKWADAFPSEVNSVNVYAFNSDGIFVKEFSESGDVLSQPDYAMRLDLLPGEYTLVGWCGLVNRGVSKESFTVISPVAGVTKLDELTCRLNTEYSQESGYFSDSRIYFLYHGNITIDLPDSQDGQDYFYTMPLVKDTNHIRLMLQQVNGNLDSDDFSMTLQAANGNMAYDNSLVGNELITYLPWSIESDILGTGGTAGSPEITEYTGIIADLSTCRMMADMSDQLYATINYEHSGISDEIFKVPVIQYALLAKPYYEEAYGHQMTDQEYLDRQDEYVMTFFLDDNMQWIYAVIEVLSWRIVIHNYGV